MSNILSKYNSLDAVSKKQVRDFIDQLVDNKGASKKHPVSDKKNTFLISTWSVHDAHLIARWSENAVH